VELGGGEARFLATLAPFVGEASGHQALYALLAPRAPETTLEALIATIDPKTIPWMLLAPVGVGLLLALIVGLVLLWLESSSPLSRLVRESQALARGEVPRIQDALHPGALGQIARAMNTTLDRIGTHAPTPLPPPLKRAAAPQPAMRTAAPTPTKVESPRGGKPVEPISEPPTDERPRKLTLNMLEQMAPVSDAYTVPTFNKTDAGPPSSERTPAMPLAQMTALADSSRQEVGPDFIDAPHLDELALPPPKATRAQTLALGAALRPMPPGPPADRGLLGEDEATTVQPARPEDPLDAELGGVFQEFFDTKLKCGEPTEGLTLDKFVLKLKANRAQLIAKYACKSVKFQVYIKDGKTALKATPVQ
jgi:hypothetical protein